MTITKLNIKEKFQKLSPSALPENLFIVIKSGWGKFWGTEKYYNNYIFPHISEDAAQFLIEMKIAGIGIDTLSPEKIPENGKYIMHEILLSENIWIIENIAHLGNCSDEKGFFLVSPLRIVSSESPIRLFFRKL